MKNITNLSSAELAQRVVKVKEGVSGSIVLVFLFFHQNVCLRYSLEATRRGASNEYHNVCFRGELRKISILLG